MNPELQETYRGVVYPWHCDHMGHMNVMWYVGKFDEATWNLFAAVGMTAAFLREVREKVLRFVHEMRTGDGAVAALCTLTGVHIDTTTRKSCPLPPDILSRARGLVRPYTPPK